MNFTIESTAFKNNEWIPATYTCKGINCSPPLNWHGAPSGTKTFALIMDDPDAPNGTWIHWIVYNIPATITHLAENTDLPLGAVTGMNTWTEQSYGGPCPPSDTHRYFFKLYALDTQLSFAGLVRKQDLLDAMQTHILDQSELIGLFGV